MALADMENSFLAQLQAPGAVFGGVPNWASLTNPSFGQGLTDFFLNEGYKRLMVDLSDLDLFLTTITFPSVASTSSYPIPLAGGPQIARVARVYYMPNGQLYNYEFRPGKEFISWEQFQTQTGQGYLAPYSFGSLPSYASLDPTRKNLVFYPGSAAVGDTIQVQYNPIPTAGASSCPTLVAATDTIVLPSDAEETIVNWALHKGWLKAREVGQSQAAHQAYIDGMLRLRARYQQTHKGDIMRIDPFNASLNGGGLW